MSRQRERGIFGRIKARPQREAMVTSSQNDLGHKLLQIQNVFDLGVIQNLHPDNRYVQEYYRANRLAYSLFHTSSDRMYMGISRDEVYKPDDLLEGARFVERYIVELGASRAGTCNRQRSDISIFSAEISECHISWY